MKKLLKNLKNKKGFSLVELIIVILLLIIIGCVVYFVFLK